MANVNSGQPVVHRLGGKLTLKKGASSYVVLNVVDGTIEVTPGGYDSIEWDSGGNLNVPLEGDPKRSKVKLTAMFTGKTGVGELLDFMLKRDTATGLKYTFDCDVEWDKYKGAGNYTKAALTNCFFMDPGSIKGGAGKDYDKVEIEFFSNDPIPGLTQYT